MSTYMSISNYILQLKLIFVFISEIREFNPNMKKKNREVTKDLEMNGLIEWDQLLFFRHGKLNRITASDACCKFEYLIMNDTTAVITEED